MTRPHRRRRHAFQVWTTLAFVLGVSLGLAAQDNPGMALEQAGIRFLVPSGFELGTTEVRGADGPVTVLLFEPEGGVVSGRPNSGSLALSVYAFDITADLAVERMVADLTLTFSGIIVTPESMDLGGRERSGVRLDFELAGLPMVGRIASFREDDVTVVAYVQGRPEELEALAPALRAILGSVSTGPLETEEAEGTGGGVELRD